ncbi:GspE/PulE family protein [Reinekea blandensis]|uniref:Type II secretory pathway, ATPase PulE/Tfp pilus assembly pathway, ATPase PilB n=1 Tax=Reinekea blandensis MED297 TaxID=314283 RepID=A4BKN4_9GAMM|nr:GspE/PulE family protein [Reinekea blandensis]EAR07313.1 Type II secretory pathway, ATPase PulE/Tfp pilus assembly pathway, ATPase PilB [Reinekea sp. MED297] [Reinekea blandensis MED297]
MNFLPGKLQFDDVLKQLESAGRVNAEQVASARMKGQGQGRHAIEQIAALQLEDTQNPGRKLTSSVLTQWLADEVGMPFEHIDPLKVDVESLSSVMSFEYAKRYHLLPLKVSEDRVQIATCEPLVTGWEDTIEQVTRKQIDKVVSTPEDIERFSLEFYSLNRSVSGAKGRTNSGGVGNFEQLVELGNMSNPDANDEHIVNIVDWLFQYAFDQRASDIHIEPRRDYSHIRFRIDGILHTVYQLPIQVGLAVVSRIKILGRMNIAEKRKPLDGRVKTKTPDGQEVELRLSTLPTAFGEKLVMRIFDPEVLLKGFDELGLADEDLKHWRSMIRQPNGIILVTGPTGSGKTTTLYSTLKSLATSEVNVCTIEDPIEMVEPTFNQMQIQSSIGLHFADGVRALMRQDPDIIMIGEIRDLETAQMAIQAALTGHLVLSTVHTNDAPSAITRLLDLGVPGYLVKSTVLGVMAQRLVRTLCPACKQPAEIHDDVWQQLVRPWSATKPARAFEPVGCLECRNTGYIGRTGVYESFVMDETLSELVHDGCDPQSLRKAAIKRGMLSLRLSGARKVASGQTTPAEVLRVTPEARQ